MILQFPQQLPSLPTSHGASKLDIIRGRFSEIAGRILNILHIPGAISDAIIKDDLTGQNIQIMVGVLFTRLTVNGCDYYFSRLAGKYDGAGMGCS